MSAVVEETYVGAASHLENELRNAAASAAQATSRQPDPGSSPSSSTGGPVREQAADLTTDCQTPNHQSQTQQQATNQGFGPGIGISPGDAQILNQATILDRYLLLCIKGRRLMELEQIEIMREGDDQVMFQDIRRAYLKIRQQQATDFHPDTPEFVRTLSRGLHSLKSSSQRLVVRMLKHLRLGWLVWWIGDNVFYIPTSANFVRVRFLPVAVSYPLLTPTSSSSSPSKRTSAPKSSPPPPFPPNPKSAAETTTTSPARKTSRTPSSASPTCTSSSSPATTSTNSGPTAPRKS